MTGSASKDEPPLATAKKRARGSSRRLVAWVVGGILGVVGAVTTISDDRYHHHDVGPYLLVAGFLLCLLAALDMGRVERFEARRLTRTVRRLTALVERLKRNQRHLEHDRDQWRTMQAEEASTNRRLTEDKWRLQRPHVFGGTAGVASTSAPTPPIRARGASITAPTSPPTERRRPRHQVRRPADNQPPLFDQDDEEG